MFPAYSSLVDLLQFRAQQQPLDTAFLFFSDGETESGRLTYAELDQRARSIAVRLQEANAEGQRALLVFPPGPEFITAFFGCLYSSVVAIPCYPPRVNQNLSRLQSIVADADIKLALTTSALLGDILRRTKDDVNLAGLQWLSTDDTDAALAASWRRPSANLDSLAFLQYTSGSTGLPKGVMLTHGNLLHNQQMIKQCFGHSQNTIVAGWLPLFHDMGLVGNVLQPLYLGVPCALMSPVTFLQKPVRWLQMISRCRATTSGGPNFAYELCLRKVTPEQCATLDLSSWDLAFTGAEPVRAETLERFAQMFAPYGFRRDVFYPCYGMAEATLFISGGAKAQPPVYVHAIKSQLEQRRLLPTTEHAQGTQTMVGCGHAWLNQKLLVVDPDLRTVCPSCSMGEIWVAGSSIASGYWNRPEENARVFGAYLADTGEGPFLRTGDLGFLNDEELFISGRLNDLIIIRGRNHAPEDIERTIGHVYPGLHLGASAAFSVEADGEEKLVVVQEVERTALRCLDLQTLTTKIRAAIAAEYGLQLHAAVLTKAASIPKTSSGKVQRHLCRRQFLENTLAILPFNDWKSGEQLGEDARALI